MDSEKLAGTFNAILLFYKHKGKEKLKKKIPMSLIPMLLCEDIVDTVNTQSILKFKWQRGNAKRDNMVVAEDMKRKN